MVSFYKAVAHQLPQLLLDSLFGCLTLTVASYLHQKLFPSLHSGQQDFITVKVLDGLVYLCSSKQVSLELEAGLSLLLP